MLGDMRRAVVLFKVLLEPATFAWADPAPDGSMQDGLVPSAPPPPTIASPDAGPTPLNGTRHGPPVSSRNGRSADLSPVYEVQVHVDW